MNARRLVLAGAAALVLAGLVAWPWRTARTSDRELPALPAKASAARAEPALPAPSRSPDASASAATPAAAEDPVCTVRAAPPPQVAEAGEPPGDAAQPAAASTPDPLAPARARLLARLAASADPYSNAVAVWLGRNGEEAGQALEARATRLAALAAGTRDPRLYGLALRLCWRRTSPACTGLSARRWSEVDPGNAMPWLMMLDEAALRQDISGMQEALFQATHAARLAERPYAPVQAIVDAADDDPAALAAARSLAVDAIGMAAAQVAPVGFIGCKGATGADANGWQQCVALKDLLENRSDTLAARLLGASIDKRLTGNAAPAAHAAALVAAAADADLASSRSCADLRGKLALLRRMAVDGEAVVAQSLAR